MISQFQCHGRRFSRPINLLVRSNELHLPTSVFFSSELQSQLMDPNTSGTNPDTTKELRLLQEQHVEKEKKIEELKAEIESIKLSLKGKVKESVAQKLENLKTLCEKYDRLRAEYNAVLAEKKREKK